jgi:hypothetical protein
VKLDRYNRVARELTNYKDCTTHFVPFFARPNLDFDRCLLGAERGIIVGNFVENSDSLGQLVQRGTAQAAINSLFDDALRGWRSQAYMSESSVVVDSLTPSGAIKTFSVEHRKRAEGYANEARALGATLSAEEIGNTLDALPAFRHRRALCHGDLHGENVRVRHGHAILIDFLNAGVGPLVNDAAALDTALTLSFAAPQGVWQQMVFDLYALDNLQTVPHVRPPTAPLQELWNSVRQVRRFGLAEQLSRNEYAHAVAIHLLRHTLRKRRPGEPRERRPVMLLLAERLAKVLAAASILAPLSS